MSPTMLRERPTAGASVRDIVDIRPAGGAIEALAERYYDLLALNPDDLRRRLTAIALDEDAAGDRRTAAHQRLAAWLLLGDEDARILAGAYDEAMLDLPRSANERRVEAERDAVLNGFGFADFRRLAGILPWLRAEDGLELLFPGGEPGRPEPSAA